MVERIENRRSQEVWLTKAYSKFLSGNNVMAETFSTVNSHARSASGYIKSKIMWTRKKPLLNPCVCYCLMESCHYLSLWKKITIPWRKKNREEGEEIVGKWLFLKK